MPFDDHGAPHGEDRRRPDPLDLVLERESAMLLLIDVQERLARAMPPEGLAQLVRNAAVLIKAAVRLGLPVVASEQYVRGLGPTVPELRELLPSPPFEKLEFSCGNNKPLARQILKADRSQVIVAGMETHVCVFQTVRDLARGDLSVFVAQDAVLSRTEANRAAGLRLCEKSGATLSTTEAILFDLLGAAGTPEFKELAPLIK